MHLLARDGQVGAMGAKPLGCLLTLGVPGADGVTGSACGRAKPLI